MKVEMYYMASCPFCKKALALLESKNVTVTLHDVNSDPKIWDESKKRSGRNTVPQIFIGNYHVGGCDDLLALERDHKLDDYLAGKQA